MNTEVAVNFIKLNIAFTIQVVFLIVLFLGLSFRNVPLLSFLEISMVVNAVYLFLQNHPYKV